MKEEKNLEKIITVEKKIDSATHQPHTTPRPIMTPR